MSSPRSRGTRSHDFAPPLYDSNNLPSPNVLGRLVTYNNALYLDTSESWMPLTGNTVIADMPDGSTSNTAAIQAAFDRLEDGGTLIIPNLGADWILDSMVSVNGKTGITVLGYGKPTIKLAASSVWGSTSPYAFKFTDCSNVLWEGITIDGNTDNASRTGYHQMLSFRYTYSALSDTTRGISNIRVRDCGFNNIFSTAVGVRQCDGVWIENNRITHGYQASQTSSRPKIAGIHVTRSDNVYIERNIIRGQDTSNNTTHFVGCGIFVQCGGDVDEWQPGINHCSVLDYLTFKEFTAPSAATATTDASVTWTTNTSSLTAEDNEFFFLCKDEGSGSGAGYIPPEMMKVQSVDDDTKTFVVRRMDGTDNAGSATNWAGQKVIWCSLNTERFAKNIHIVGNEIRNCHGLFMLGVRNFEITGNTAKSVRDISLDVEWGMDGVFNGNAVYGATTSGMDILFFGHNITFTGNTVTPYQGIETSITGTGLRVQAHHEIISNIAITGNVLHGAIGAVHDASGYTNNIDGLVITGNVIRPSFNPNYGVNSGTLQAAAIRVGVNIQSTWLGDMVRDVIIANNYIGAVAQRPITIQGVDGISIINNRIVGAGQDAILDNNSASRQSSRVYVDGNVVDTIGRRGGSFRFYNALVAITDPPKFGPSNQWMNTEAAIDGTQNFMNDGGTNGTYALAPLGARATWNPGSIDDGNNEELEVTVTGAELGDFAQAAFSADLTAGMMLAARVSAADTVKVTLHNESGSTVNLGSGVLRVKVTRA